MKGKALLIFSVAMLLIASVLPAVYPGIVEANSTLKDRIQSIQEERAENQAEAEEKGVQISVIQEEIKQVENDIKVIDHQTAETNQQIRDKNKEIEATEERIDELVAEINMLEDRIAERDDLLKSRVRSMYKNGGSVSYLEVVLGARSFGDLINRITALSTIAQQDRNILEAHHNDKLAVEDAKVLMEGELLTLENQLQELEGLKATLENQRKEKDRLMAELDQQEGELHAELGELENTDKILAAQEIAMKQELAAWEKRQRELEEARKKAGNGTPPITVDGQFMRPTTGNLTSSFGFRWGTMHYGIDIGKGGRSGDVHVVAVEAGTVISSYYSPSYGNVVLISHNVNGQVITTLYAHLENRFVVDGQRVEKGQLLGYMGNTGRSFGAHLHFEVHEGPWNNAKSNAVDPLRYIPR